MSEKATAKPELTQARLKELLHYDPETGIFTWVAPTSPRVRVGQTAGSDDGHGYIQIMVDGRLYRAHRVAWLYVTGAWPPSALDHVNHRKTDNRFANLRPATDSQNQGNKPLSRANTSGRKGVSWHKKRGKWLASIKINGKKRHLGLFTDIDAASAAYAAAARDAFGDFAHIA